GWPKIISQNNSQATVCSDNNSMLTASSSTLASILLVAIAIDINISLPNKQFRADPTIQIDVNMSTPSHTAVPTVPNPHIINLEASPPWCSTYLSHANDLADVTMIGPFFSLPPCLWPPQGIRLDVLLPSHGSVLLATLMPHTGINLDASPLCHTPLCLQGVAALQPRPTLGSTTLLLPNNQWLTNLSPALPSTIYLLLMHSSMGWTPWFTAGHFLPERPLARAT
ncbi:hypothetical protein PAXRUDRAFT_149467, partial [Paxillus rubicundulus Ve08.2h10]